MIGQNLGHYKIEDQLGAGGMGVVYRATDSTLGRQVAIKVLPEAWAQDPERRARFEREARLLAALNHPNIAGIYGLEQDAGVHYLILELVPGETLAQRLAAGPLEMEATLGICRQIAEALEAAHDKGIIHRDLKPANVKITPEGKVKVLDFGLAKAEPEPAAGNLSQLPTLTVEATRPGVILGTAAYMSPEQARGKPLDKRTDIWSLGCVLYEALAGRRAFAGESVSDCMVAVLGQEPDYQAVAASTPPSVHHLLRRCLQKDPQRRLRDIGEARIELEEALAALSRSSGVAAAPELPRAGAPPAVVARTPILLAGAASLLLGLAVGLAMRGASRPLPPAPALTRFAAPLAPNENLLLGWNPPLALSPDGALVAYIAVRGGKSQIYLRRMDQLEARPLAGTEGAQALFFSPDGRWLGFGAGKMKKISLGGGPPLTICGESFFGAHWGPDDRIVFSPGWEGLQRVSAAGGAPEPLTTLDGKRGERGHLFPEVLPGGKAVLYTVRPADTESFDDARIAVQVLATGERKTLLQGGTNAHYSPTGHLIYARAGSLLAAPFDLERLAVTGPPQLVQEGVEINVANGVASFSVARNGTLVYAPGAAHGVARTLVWVDRTGTETPLPLPARAYLHPRLSSDGGRIVVEIEGTNHNVWAHDIARGTLMPLTFGGEGHWPLWTPDGRRVAFLSSKTWGAHWIAADGSGGDEPLATGKGQSVTSWSPDGKLFAFTQSQPETGMDIWVQPVGAGASAQPFVRRPGAQAAARFSPDGRWIAYVSTETSRPEVYAQPFPGPGEKVQISTEGGLDPHWASNGKELFFRQGDKMMVASVTTGASLTVSPPRVLFEGRYNRGLSSSCASGGPTSTNYDVSPDGRRFLMVKDADPDSGPTQMHVALNWSSGLLRPAGSAP